jgi:hypothetical protein
VFHKAFIMLCVKSLPLVKVQKVVASIGCCWIPRIRTWQPPPTSFTCQREWKLQSSDQISYVNLIFQIA